MKHLAADRSGQKDLGHPQPLQIVRLRHFDQLNKQESMGGNGSCANIKSVASWKG